MWGRTPQGLAKLRAAVINAKNPLHFTAVWVVGLSQVEAGEHVYNVCQLDVSRGDARAFQVRINKDFTAWKVTRVQ
jgi:hypothetical protein